MATASSSSSLELPARADNTTVDLLLELLRCSATVAPSRRTTAASTTTTGATLFSHSSSSHDAPTSSSSLQTGTGTASSLQHVPSSTLSSLKGSVHPPSSSPPPLSAAPREGERRATMEGDMQQQQEQEQQVHALCQKLVAQLLARERSLYRALLCVELNPDAAADVPYVMDGEEEWADIMRLRSNPQQQQQQQEQRGSTAGLSSSQSRHRVRPLSADEVSAASACWPCVLLRDAHLQRSLARAVEQLETRGGNHTSRNSYDDQTVKAEAKEEKEKSVKGATSAAAESGHSASRNQAFSSPSSPIAVSTRSARTRISWVPASLRRAGSRLEGRPSVLAVDAARGADLLGQLTSAVATSARTLSTTSRGVMEFIANTSYAPLQMSDVTQRYHISVPSVLHSMLGNPSRTVPIKTNLKRGGESAATDGLCEGLRPWVASQLVEPTVKALGTYRRAPAQLGNGTDNHNTINKTDDADADDADGGDARGADANTSVHSLTTPRGPAQDVNVQLQAAIRRLLHLPCPCSTSPSCCVRCEAHMVTSAMPLIVGLVYKPGPARSDADADADADVAVEKDEENEEEDAAAVLDGLLTSWGVEALDASGLRVRLVPAARIATTTTATATSPSPSSSAPPQPHAHHDAWSDVSSVTTSTSHAESAATHAAAASSPPVPPVRFSACVLEMRGAVRNEAAARQVWLLLVSIVHFVHVVGTRDDVAQAAHFVAEAVRERRRRRGSDVRVHPLRAAQESSMAEVSAPITVLAFFFTLRAQAELERQSGDGGDAPPRTDVARDPSVQLFPPTPDVDEADPDAHTDTPGTVEMKKRQATSRNVAPSASTASPRLAPPPQLTPLGARSGGSRTATQTPDAGSAAPPSQQRSVAEWMYHTLIPSFFDITYEDVPMTESAADTHGVNGAMGLSSSLPTTASSAAAAQALGTKDGTVQSKRRQRRPKRKKKTSLLARVQYISDEHADLLHWLLNEDVPPREGSKTLATPNSTDGHNAVVASDPSRAGENVLIRFILCRQLFFRDVLLLAMSHYGTQGAVGTGVQAAALAHQPSASTSRPPHHSSPPHSSVVPVEAVAEVPSQRVFSPHHSGSPPSSPTASLTAGVASAAAAGGGQRGAERVSSPSSPGRRRVSFNSTLIMHPATPPPSSSSASPVRAASPSSSSPLGHRRNSTSLLSSYSSASGGSPSSTPVPVTVRSGSVLNTPAQTQVESSVLSISAPRTEASSVSAASPGSPTSLATAAAAAAIPTPVRSILKSGHRYRVSKLIRNSAPASSVVPFNNAMLWRCLVAEQLGAVAAASPSPVRHASASDECDRSWSGIFHVTSAMYTAHVSSLVTRVSDEVASLLLLGSLREAAGSGDDAHSEVTIAVQRDARQREVSSAAASVPTSASVNVSRQEAKTDTPYARDVHRRVLFRQLAFVSEAVTNALNAPFCYAQLNPSGPVQTAPSVLVSAARLTCGRTGPSTSTLAETPAGANDNDDGGAASPLRVTSPWSTLRATSTEYRVVACSALSPILPLSVGGRFRLYCEVSARTCVFAALLYVCPVMDANLRLVTYSLLKDKMAVLAKPIVRFVERHLLVSGTAPESAEADSETMHVPQTLPSIADYTRAQECSLRLICQLGAHLSGAVLLANKSSTAANVVVAPVVRSTRVSGAHTAAEDAENNIKGSRGVDATRAQAKGNEEEEQVAQDIALFRPSQAVRSFEAQHGRFSGMLSDDEMRGGDGFTDALSNALRPRPSWVVPGEASQYDLESALLLCPSEAVDGDGEDACELDAVADALDLIELSGRSRSHGQPVSTSTLRAQQVSSFAQWLPAFISDVPPSLSAMAVSAKGEASHPLAQHADAEEESVPVRGDDAVGNNGDGDGDGGGRVDVDVTVLQLLSDPAVHYMVGVSENTLLRPWLREAKKVVLSSFLSGWFLPRWTSWSTQFQPGHSVAAVGATVDDDDSPLLRKKEVRIVSPVTPTPPPTTVTSDAVSLEVVRGTLVRLAATAAQLEAALTEVRHTLSVGSPLPLQPTFLPPLSVSPSSSPARQPLRRPPQGGSPPLPSSVSSAPLTPPRFDIDDHIPSSVAAAGGGGGPVGSGMQALVSIATSPVALFALETPMTSPRPRSAPVTALAISPSLFGVVNSVSAPAAGGGVEWGQPNASHAPPARRRVSFSQGPPPGAEADPLHSGGIDDSSAGTDTAAAAVPPPSHYPTSIHTQHMNVARPSIHIAHPTQQQQQQQQQQQVSSSSPAAVGAGVRSLQQSVQVSQLEAAQLARDIAELLHRLTASHPLLETEPAPPHDDSDVARESSEPMSRGFQGSRCSTPSEEELPKPALSRVASQRYAPLHLAEPNLSMSHAGGIGAGSGYGRGGSSSFFGAPMASMGNSELISLPKPAPYDSGFGAPAACDSMLTMSRPNVPELQPLASEGTLPNAEHAEQVDETKSSLGSIRSSGGAAMPSCTHEAATQTHGRREESDRGRSTHAYDSEANAAATLPCFHDSGASDADEDEQRHGGGGGGGGRRQPTLSPSPSPTTTSETPASSSSPSSQRRSPSMALSLDPVNLGRPRLLTSAETGAKAPRTAGEIRAPKDASKERPGTAHAGVGGGGSPGTPSMPLSGPLVMGSPPSADSLMTAYSPSFNLPTARPPPRKTAAPSRQEQEQQEEEEEKSFVAVPDELPVVARSAAPNMNTPPPPPMFSTDIADIDAPRTPCREPQTRQDADGPPFPLSPSPTPKSLAAVTALADLQQQLSGSKHSMDAMTRRARAAEEALAEKEALVDALQQRLVGLEAQLATAAVVDVAEAAVQAHTEPDSPGWHESPSPTSPLPGFAFNEVDAENASATQHKQTPLVSPAENQQSAAAAASSSSAASSALSSSVAVSPPRVSEFSRDAAQVVEEDTKRSGRPRLPPPPPTPPPSTRLPEMNVSATPPRPTAPPASTQVVHPPSPSSVTSTPLNSLELWRQKRRDQQQSQQTQTELQPHHDRTAEAARTASAVVPDTSGESTPTAPRACDVTRAASTPPHMTHAATSPLPSPVPTLLLAPPALPAAKHTQVTQGSQTTPPPSPGPRETVRAASPPPSPPPTPPPLPQLSGVLPSAAVAAAAPDVRAEEWQRVLDSERAKHAMELAQLERRLREAVAASTSRERSLAELVRSPEEANQAREAVATVKALEAELTQAGELLRAARETARDATRNADNATATVDELRGALRDAREEQATLRDAVRATESVTHEAVEAKHAAEARLRKLSDEVTSRRAQRDHAEKVRGQADDLLWTQARVMRQVLHQERLLLVPWMQQKIDLFAAAAASLVAESAATALASAKVADRTPHRTGSGSRAQDQQQQQQPQQQHRDPHAHDDAVSSSSADTSSPASTASYASAAHAPAQGRSHSRPRHRARARRGTTLPTAADAAAALDQHDDPLGLQFELDRQRRRALALEEALKQHEAAHEADKRTIHTLQHLLDVQRDLGSGPGGDGDALSAPTRAPQLPWALKANFMPSQTPPASSTFTTLLTAPSRAESSNRPKSASRVGIADGVSQQQQQQQRAPTSLARSSVASTARRQSHPTDGRGDSVTSLTSPGGGGGGDAGGTSPPPRRAAAATVHAPDLISVVATGATRRSPLTSSYPLSAIENSRSASTAARGGSAEPTVSQSRSRATPVTIAPPLSATPPASADAYRQRYASLKAYL